MPSRACLARPASLPTATLALLGCALVSGCVSSFSPPGGAEVAARDPAPNATPIILVPGFKGSSLVDSQGRTGWLTGSAILDVSTPSLALPLRWENGHQARDDWQPRGVLARAVILPGIGREEIYGSFVDAAQTWGSPVLVFPYDWRRDPQEAVEQLEAYVDEVRARYHVPRVHIVAHSMGGLVTCALLHRRPEVIDRIVFAGVPFAGGAGFLQDAHVGTATGLNRGILSPEILFTFTSIYTLFALAPSGLLLDRDGHALPLDFFRAQDWRDAKLGIWAQGGTDAQQEFLTEALATAERFRRQAIAPFAQDPLPWASPAVLVVAGVSRPTLASLIKDGPRSVQGWDAESAPRCAGDGRVCAGDALPPKGIVFDRLETDAEHSQLLNDARVIESVRAFLAHSR